MSLGPMDRRDFLRLSVKGRRRVLELSCERLYMLFVDAGASAAHSPPEDTGSVPWMGEPPTEVVRPTAAELFEGLERRLAEADVLRVLDREWLAVEGFREEVEARIEAFRRGGGSVEYAAADAAAPRPRASALLLALVACLTAPIAAQTVPDEVLEARVEAALAGASDLPTDSITVEVRDGVVTLSGSVVCETCGGTSTPGGTGTVQQSLGAVVRAVPGVGTVRFQLAYRPR